MLAAFLQAIRTQTAAYHPIRESLQSNTNGGLVIEVQPLLLPADSTPYLCILIAMILDLDSWY